MTINITTTHTVTCTDAPVEDVYRELDEKFPRLNPLDEAYKNAVDAKDDITRQLTQERADHEGDRGEMQARVADLARERDEVQKRLEESQTVKEKLMAENKALAARGDALYGAFETQQMRVNRLERKLKEANEAILAAGSRPALPEGMRIAEHKYYGRVVVSPETNANGYYMFFTSVDSTAPKAAYWYADPSDLTFLDEEPAPAPLPKPEDCKPGEVYLVKVNIRGESKFIAERSVVDSSFPWEVPALDDNLKDAGITLLARLLPDREIKEQA